MKYSLLPLMIFAAPALPQRLAPTYLYAGDGFGWSLDLDPSGQLIVGAPFANEGGEIDSGRAYIFQRVYDGWEPLLTSSALVPTPQQNYGESVAIDDIWALVGTPSDDAVRFLRRLDGTWIEGMTLGEPEGVLGRRFGQSVALDGKRILIGAPADNEHGGASGAVHAWRYGVLLWSDYQKLIPPGHGPGDNLGLDVSIDGDQALFSCHGDDDLATNAGAVWLVERDGGDWYFSQKIYSPDAATDQRFGSRVAISGHIAVVGHPEDDDMGTDAGAVYVFRRVNGQFVPDGKIYASDASVSDGFGASVAVRGETVVVGASLHDAGGVQAGAAYVFEYRWGGWQEDGILVAPDADPLDYGGQALTFFGDEILVGMHGDDRGGFNAGALYRYERRAWDGPWAIPYCRCEVTPDCGTAFAEGGCVNRSTKGGRLDWFGSLSTAVDDLVLTAVDLPYGQISMLFAGDEAQSVPFGSGNLCVASSAGYSRLPVRVAQGGQAQWGPGLIQYASATFGAPGAFDAGRTWYFQVWFRDPFSGCSPSLNLTDAVAITFEP